jgi:hypothetical protein
MSESEEISNDLVSKVLELNSKMDKFLESLLPKSKEHTSDIHEAFIRASLNFKTPVFNSKVSYGSTKFEYADLKEVLNCIKKPLLDEGLYICHETYFKDNEQHLRTFLRYKDGGEIGNQDWLVTVKSKEMKEVGAQITYLKRYSLCNICSLAAESDNDVKEVQTLNQNQKEEPVKYITKEQTIILNDLFLKVNEEQQQTLLTWSKASETSKITQDKFIAVQAALNRIISKKVNAELNYDQD